MDLLDRLLGHDAWTTRQLLILQQRVQRLALRLGANVPQRDVDGRDAEGDRPIAPEIVEAAEQHARQRGDDLIGRYVNLASRITSLAGPGEVLCTQALADEATRSHDCDGVRFDELGPAFVRGFAYPVPLVRAYR